MPSPPASFSRSSRARLTRHDLGRFESERLFDRLGRSACQAGCLPRKELFEAWEVARRVRRLFRGGRVVDMGGGHGLLAHVLLLLDDTSPSALVVDRAMPPSAQTLHQALARTWPRLTGRVTYLAEDFAAVPLDAADLVVSCHACGALTDAILARAVAVRARVAVLPCCHDADTCDAGSLAGWMELPLAIDAIRAQRLAAHAYTVWAQSIPRAITPKNRLLIGAPA